MYKQSYPRDPLPYDNLAGFYLTYGHLEKSLETAREEARLNPESVGGYINLAKAYRGLNRLDEARATLQTALQRKIRGWNIPAELFLTGLALQDTAIQERARGLLRSSPEGEMNLTIMEARLALSRGQFQQGRMLFAKAKDAAVRLNLPELASDMLAQQAIFDALTGNKKQAIQSADAALAAAQNAPLTTWDATVALAIAGREARAQALLQGLKQKYPDSVDLHVIFGPLVPAWNALNHNDAEKALQALRPGMAYDTLTSTPLLFTRATVYLAAAKPDEARQQFQKIRDLRNLSPEDPVLPLAVLGQARAYAHLRDVGNARTAYQDFFALWKAADPDIQILREAKAEYAKLHL